MRPPCHKTTSDSTLPQTKGEIVIWPQIPLTPVHSKSRFLGCSRSTAHLHSLLCSSRPAPTLALAPSVAPELPEAQAARARETRFRQRTLSGTCPRCACSQDMMGTIRKRRVGENSLPLKRNAQLRTLLFRSDIHQHFSKCKTIPGFG